jgi:ascorbate-specific PTS system EIIC-type component UlaA
MTQKTNSRGNIRATVGAALLLIGSTVLVGYSAALAWQFQAALNSSAIDSLGFFGSIGLASLRAVSIVALDHALLLSVARRILVLCSALIVTLIGIALLPKRGRGETLPKGDQ